jgi:hypothetical protein
VTADSAAFFRRRRSSRAVPGPLFKFRNANMSVNYWRQLLPLWLLLQSCQFEVLYAANEQAQSTVCYSHDSCGEAHFCAWANCTTEAGSLYPCGICKPCAQCICDSDAIDYECPLRQCPQQPLNGVRFLQGEFYDISNLNQNDGYACVRRFVVTGSMFSFLQLPVYTDHPANSPVLNQSALTPLLCPTYLITGVLESQVSSDPKTLSLRALLTSEGNTANC